MPILTTKTSIFIEFENILFDTDTFIMGELYTKYMSQSEEISHLFNPLSELVKKYGLNNLQFFSQIKHNINPLYDFINRESNIDNKKEICDFLYSEILYGDYDDDYMDNLELTTLGKSIHQLLVDNNMEKLYIYLNKETDSIMNFLINWLGHDSRIDYITGNKNDFLENVECTSYMLSNYSDIESISKLHNPNLQLSKDVVIPQYKFNMNSDDSIKSTNIPYDELMDKFNIIVSSVKLPIV